ncbi:MAG: SRPBCC family protein [Blastocatellia bacterium]
MADIQHQFPVRASAARVFAAMATPAGLDAWWTKRSAGEPVAGAEYEFWFPPEYDWRGVVTRCVPNAELDWEITRADADWQGTRVGFRLREAGGVTTVSFHHSGWATPNEHFRISSYCWATYLRLLKRYVEHGEIVAYENRDTA